jgi:hypothetical protein
MVPIGKEKADEQTQNSLLRDTAVVWPAQARLGPNLEAVRFMAVLASGRSTCAR